MQKKLKWFFIILHAITFPSLIVAYYWIVKDPIIHRFLFYMLVIWGVFAMYSPLIYLRILPLLLPHKKAHAQVVNRSSTQTHWRVGKINTKLPLAFLTFELDNSTRKTISVPWKIYYAFPGGETGTLIYKDSGEYLFFVDFIKDQY